MPEPEKHYDRRLALKALAAGATALGVGSGLTLPSAAADEVAKSPPGSGGGHFDAVIIGGGMAGVTAARELGERGKRCVILEARNRLGGRTFSTEVFGERGDVGGQWMHWIQPHVWAELTRYGLVIAESPGGNPSSVGVIIDGQFKRLSPEESLPLLTEGMTAIFPEVNELFPRPFDPWFNPDFVKLDNLSLAARMNQTKLSPLVRAMLETYFTTAISGPTSSGGLLDLMHWFARANGDGSLLLRACSQFKLRDGTTALLDHIVADGKPDVRLNTIVSKVEQTGQQVNVITEDGLTFSAPVCIVALPMNCWNDIEWRPGLLLGKTAASAEKHAGAGFELHIKVAGRQDGYLGMAPDGNAINLLYTDKIGQSESIMVGMGSTIGEFDINDDAQIAKALQVLMPEAKLLESYAYDWNSDPFSKGTWCTYRPGMWSKYGLAMRQTENRLVFAGSDVANGWRGFIDGAIETGLRASRDAISILSKG